MHAPDSSSPPPPPKCYLIVVNRSDLLVPRTVVEELLAVAEGGGGSCRILVACPDQFRKGCEKWGSSHDDKIEMIPYNPGETIQSCKEAAEKLVDSLQRPEESNIKLDGLLFNWHGCIPGRGFEKMDDSGLLFMAQYKIMGLVTLMDTLLKKSLFAEVGARIIVAASEAARGIPEMEFPVPTFDDDDSLESFTSALNGTRIQSPNYNELYGHVEAMLTLYVGSVARKYPHLHITTMSPGFTLDSLIYEVGLETGISKYLTVKAMRLLFPLLISSGLGVDYLITAKQFADSLLMGKEKPEEASSSSSSGLLLAPDKETSKWVDQSKVEGGSQLVDIKKQDLCYEALMGYLL